MLTEYWNRVSSSVPSLSSPKLRGIIGVSSVKKNLTNCSRLEHTAQVKTIIVFKHNCVPKTVGKQEGKALADYGV